MIAVVSKACEKEAGVALGWMTSSPTSLVVGSLASWADRVAPGMEDGGEGRTWSIHSSKTQFEHSHFLDVFIAIGITEIAPDIQSNNIL